MHIHLRLSLFFVSAGLLLAGWLLFGQHQPIQPHPPSHFSDSQLGFSLEFPPSWYGVQTLRVSTSDYDYVAFTHPTKLGPDGRDGKLEFSIFVLDRTDQQLPVNSIELAERNGTRYAYKQTDSPLPSALASARHDIEGILSTFTTSGR